MTSSTIRVAVVGGGIGGAAAAYALLRAGLDVKLYEQAPALAEVGAGVAVQPNGVRMLDKLGLGDAFQRTAARWVDPQYRRADGRLAASMWPAEISDQIQFYGMHRADLLALFVDKLPANVVHTDHKCIGYEESGDAATLVFANGRRAAADVVIAADGIHSTLQQFVVAPSKPVFSGFVAHRGIISAENVSWQPGAMRNWLGDNRHLLVFPVRANTLVNYVAFLMTDEQSRESWSAPGDPAALAAAFAGWDPLVGKILASTKTTFRWGLYDREPLARWTRGRLTLLGDAAHPMLPHAGQGANQAIEDGVTLATVLARVDRASAPRALLVYEALRRERTANVQQRSRLNGARYYSTDAGRDRELGEQYRERAWIWSYDAEAEATKAAAAL